MVRINRVYTKTGDRGETSLIGGARVAKSNLRIECYGTVDELNSCLGLVKASLETDQKLAALMPIIERVQNELFNVGALLATPDAERRKKMPQVRDQHITQLENDLDEYNDTLPELTSFVLPGGGLPGSFLHQARTICRRAERLVVALAATESVDDVAVTYLNRLSDALFVFARWATVTSGRAEPLWVPEAT